MSGSGGYDWAGLGLARLNFGSKLCISQIFLRCLSSSSNMEVCSVTHSSRCKKQESKSKNNKDAHFKTFLVLHMLAFHWPRQVTGWSPTSMRCRNIFLPGRWYVEWGSICWTIIPSNTSNYFSSSLHWDVPQISIFITFSIIWFAYIFPYFLAPNDYLNFFSFLLSSTSLLFHSSFSKCSWVVNFHCLCLEMCFEW